ncbi:hypothetical protein AGLY_010029, partial [Aphis glycines]
YIYNLQPKEYDKIIRRKIKYLLNKFAHFYYSKNIWCIWCHKKIIVNSFIKYKVDCSCNLVWLTILLNMLLFSDSLVTVYSRCVKFEINEYDKSLNKINDSEWRSWVHLMAPRIFCLLFIYITLICVKYVNVNIDSFNFQIYININLLFFFKIDNLQLLISIKIFKKQFYNPFVYVSVELWHHNNMIFNDLYTHIQKFFQTYVVAVEYTGPSWERSVICTIDDFGAGAASGGSEGCALIQLYKGSSQQQSILIKPGTSI